MDVSNSESTLLTSQERPTVTLMHYLGDPVGAKVVEVKVVEVIVVGVVVVKVVAVVGIGIVVAKVVEVIVMGIVVMKVTLRSTMLMVMVLPS